MPDLSVDAEVINDRLARDHPIDDYYTCSPLPIRLIEQRRLTIIRELVGNTAGADVAEVGSGGGHVLRMFPAARITAIDVSGVFLENARKNLRSYDARFVKGELDKLESLYGSFDLVICTEVLEHTRDPAPVLRGIARMLRPGGRAVITAPNDPLIDRLKGLLRRTAARHVLGDRINWGGDSYHLHRWTPRELEQLLTRFFRVSARRDAPSRLLPIRVCFRCEALSVATELR